MIRFQTMRSGSSGNLLLLEFDHGGGRGRYLVDCGISSQKALTGILEESVGLSRPLDGVLVTHAHFDHINYPSLRVLDRLGVPVYLHRQTLEEVGHRYLNRYRLPARVDLSGLEMRAFGDQSFRLDGLQVTPVAVPHAPGVTTHAFALQVGDRRLLIASDLRDPETVAPHITDRDLIYLESNYDPELLRLHFNPASLFHLSNPTTGLLLRFALERSRRAPAAVVLGHLSEQRNRPELALGTVQEVLAEGGGNGCPALVAAPRYSAGEPVVLDA